MMRAYNYLLFRIYRFYTDRIKEKDIPLIYTSSVSTILVYFNLNTIYSYLVYKDVVKEIIPNKFYALIPMVIIWVLNYFIFVRRARFLECNFRKDIRGGVFVIMYFLLTAALAINIANYSRSKITELRRNHPKVSQTKQKPSLEGKIRKWFNDNF
jgi:hypothetical protein